MRNITTDARLYTSFKGNQLLKVAVSRHGPAHGTGDETAFNRCLQLLTVKKKQAATVVSEPVQYLLTTET